jgi:hypothetical protein
MITLSEDDSISDLYMLHRWWVTWPSDRPIMDQRSTERLNLIYEMKTYLYEHECQALMMSNINGRSGFGFMNQIDAIQFYLTFSDRGDVLKL